MPGVSFTPGITAEVRARGDIITPEVTYSITLQYGALVQTLSDVRTWGVESSEARDYISTKHKIAKIFFAGRCPAPRQATALDPTGSVTPGITSPAPPRGVCDPGQHRRRKCPG